jgi:hypothetical protein
MSDLDNASMFIAGVSRDDNERNEIPSGHARRNSLYWDLVGPMLGLESRDAPVQSPNSNLEVIRAYERRRAEADGVTLAELAGEIAVHGLELAKEVVAKVRRPSELERAKAWLAETLTGEMLAGDVERMAGEAGISARTLRRARKALMVRTRKHGRGPWYWTPLKSGQDDKAAG